VTLMQSNDKEARCKERGRVTCAQRLVQQMSRRAVFRSAASPNHLTHYFHI
jgi:hypothetical protein